ncbi:MAG: four helix bundle protein [Sulfurovum sp.]|nr:four helix bundle protein [Sulfurovum sp.]
MSDYYHLDVYKASYKLLVEIHRSFTNLNKEHKYTIGERVKEKVFNVLVGIYKANKSSDKVLVLEQVLDDVEYIRLSLRLLRDLRVLNEKKYVRLLVLCEDVRGQFEKWCGYETRKS